MYRAIFQEYGTPDIGRTGYASEEVWGYFRSPEQFKQAVLERFTSKRDEPVFTEDNDAVVVVRWRYVNSFSRSCLRLVEISDSGWLTRKWPYGAPQLQDS